VRLEGDDRERVVSHGKEEGEIVRLSQVRQVRRGTEQCRRCREGEGSTTKEHVQALTPTPMLFSISIATNPRMREAEGEDDVGDDEGML
jgi:hypothetical protein